MIFPYSAIVNAHLLLLNGLVLRSTRILMLVSFFEKEREYLFTDDLVYQETLLLPHLPDLAVQEAVYARRSE